MKTFQQYLQEMALRSYRTAFHKEPRGEEGYGEDPVTGAAELGDQVDVNPDGGKSSIFGRFSKKDRAVISHPKTFRTLEEKLSRSGYHFNILLVEDRAERQLGTSSAQALMGYKEQVQEYIAKNRIETEGHITFVKNGTSGHVLTPWMILHTLGHAVGDHIARRRLPTPPIFSLINQIAHELDPGCTDRVDLLPHERQEECLEAASRVFMFRSASLGSRQGSMHTSDESFHELVAEYLWNGHRIRVRPPYNENPRIMSVVADMEEKVRDALDMCVGQVIYDYYG